MSKAIQVFLSAAKFRLNKLTYYLTINQFSDLTPEEEQRKLSGDTGEYPSDSEGYDDMMDDDQVERVLKAELENQKRTSKMTAFLTLDKKTVRQPLLDRAARAKHRQRRSTKHQDNEVNLEAKLFRAPARNAVLKLSIADLIRIPTDALKEEDGKKLKIKWLVPSNNPNYTPVGFYDADAARKDMKPADIPEDQVKKIEQ